MGKAVSLNEISSYNVVEEPTLPSVPFCAETVIGSTGRSGSSMQATNKTDNNFFFMVFSFHIEKIRIQDYSKISHLNTKPCDFVTRQCRF
jgi:hypothetical protein